VTTRPYAVSLGARCHKRSPIYSEQEMGARDAGHCNLHLHHTFSMPMMSLILSGQPNSYNHRAFSE